MSYLRKLLETEGGLENRSGILTERRNGIILPTGISYALKVDGDYLGKKNMLEIRKNPVFYSPREKNKIAPELPKVDEVVLPVYDLISATVGYVGGMGSLSRNDFRDAMYEKQGDIHFNGAVTQFGLEFSLGKEAGVEGIDLDIRFNTVTTRLLCALEQIEEHLRRIPTQMRGNVEDWSFEKHGYKKWEERNQ